MDQNKKIFVIDGEIVTKKEFEINEDRKKGCKFSKNGNNHHNSCSLISSEENEIKCYGTIESQHRCPFWNK